jgi:hypothetical protein
LLVGEGATTTSGPLPDGFFVLARRVETVEMLDRSEALEARGLEPWPNAIRRERLERRDGVVELTAIDATRFEWQLLPGADGQGHTCERDLDERDGSRVSLRIGLGASDMSRPRGLALDGTAIARFTGDRAVLVARGDETALFGEHPLGLALTVDDMTTEGDGAELVLLAEAGVIQREARELGANRRRAVLCMRGSDLLLHASGVFDNSAPLVEEVVARGCRRVASADRGRLASGVIERSGIEGTPLVGANEVVLVGLSTSRRGLARSLRR